MGDLFINLIWAVVVLVVVVTAIVAIFLSPFSTTIKPWAEMKVQLSENKKQVELRKLQVLEKNPDMFKEIMDE